MLRSDDDATTAKYLQAFLSEVEEICDNDRPASGATAYAPRFVVVEGLDGSGKSTLVKTLAERLGGKAVGTPPTGPGSKEVRALFDRARSPYSRAYYLVSNYVLAERCRKECMAAKQNILYVVDRYYTSTVGYNMCDEDVADGDGGDPVRREYRWPVALLKPECVLVLNVDIRVRRERMRKR